MFSGRTVEPHFRQNNSSSFNFFFKVKECSLVMEGFFISNCELYGIFIHLFNCFFKFFSYYCTSFYLYFRLPFFHTITLFSSTLNFLLLLYANPSLKKNPLFYLDIKLTIKNIDIVRVGNSFKHMNTAVIWGPLLMSSQRRRILDCISILGKG